MYAMGQAGLLEQDTAEALRWLRLARAQGVEDLEPILDHLLSVQQEQQEQVEESESHEDEHEGMGESGDEGFLGEIESGMLFIRHSELESLPTTTIMLLL